jgi:hypothetical protein
MDLFKVEVMERSEGRIVMRLRIDSLEEVTFPLSSSFAIMLVDDVTEMPEASSAFSSWVSAQEEKNELFLPRKTITAVRLLEVRGLPRVHGEPPAGMTRDDVDRSTDPGVLGEALYEITTDAPGMFDHLAPGDSWGSSAYDEMGEGPYYTGADGDPRAWERS